MLKSWEFDWIYTKEDFIEKFKMLDDISLKIILLDNQN